MAVEALAIGTRDSTAALQQARFPDRTLPPALAAGQRLEHFVIARSPVDVRRYIYGRALERAAAAFVFVGVLLVSFLALDYRPIVAILAEVFALTAFITIAFAVRYVFTTRDGTERTFKNLL